MSGTHLISRLQYRVSCPDEAQAFEARHTLSSTITQEISDAIDEVCSRYSVGDQWLRIPKLEIDLGNLSMQSLRSGAVALFSYHFEQALQKAIANQQGDPRDALASLPRTEALLYFLENGFLPGWVYAPEVELDQLVNEVLTSNGATLREFLLTRSDQKNIWLRLSRQFDEPAKEQVLRLIPKLYEALVQLIETASAQQEEAVAKEILLDAVLTHAVAILNGELSNEALSAQITLPQHGRPDGHDEVVQLAANLSPQRDTDSWQTHDTFPNEYSNTSSQQLLHANDQYSLYEKLVVPSAGIVLLHPYLRPFFTELHLFDGHDWASEQAREKAVHLLHYLSTGHQTQPEWNLTLEKIICGVPLEVPIERKIIIDQQQLDECAALLTSVIENWPALKNTSPAGLQETFLRRTALLRQTKKGWLLQVERKTHDILLEALPWSFSMIRFPWTNYLIEVVWI